MLHRTLFWARPFAALIGCALLLVSPGRPAAAQARPISQTRINEYAAVLLRVHRALIEEPGLRRPGEPLDAYMQRIAAPLPGETGAQYQGRLKTYKAALKSLSDGRGLCTAVPTLRDNSGPNRELWQAATRADAALPTQWERLETAFAQTAKGRSGPLAEELKRTVLLIKTAFEALREARP